MKHLLHVVLMVAAYLFHASAAPADEPKTSPASAASSSVVSAKSDLDEDLPPDVRAKLSPEQLHDIMLERAKHPARSASGEPPAVAIIVPVTMFAMIFAIVVVVVYANFRRDRQRHETIRVAIERGGEIPPALLIPARKPRSDLRRGVLLLSAGLGLGVLLFKTAKESGAWTAALIPIFLGLGYLVVHKLEGRKQDT